MQYKRISGMFFSPTGVTERVIKTITEVLGNELNLPTTHVSFTLPKEREAACTFTDEDIVVLGTPVYAGRVPNVLLTYLDTIAGNGAIAIPIVSFGNRAYEDALIELRDILVGDGFKAMAAGAFVGEHSFSKTLGVGRPDEADLTLASDMAKKIVYKLTSQPLREDTIKVSGTEAPYRPYFQPRDHAGNPIYILKVKPKTSDNCIDCKLCVNICPMGSIDYNDVSKLNSFCIKCGACIKRCPKQAKYFDDPGYLEHVRDLEETYIQPAKSIIFL